jgi:hypothetical protein
VGCALEIQVGDQADSDFSGAGIGFDSSHGALGLSDTAGAEIVPGWDRRS